MGTPILMPVEPKDFCPIRRQDDPRLAEIVRRATSPDQVPGTDDPVLGRGHESFVNVFTAWPLVRTAS